MAHSNGDTILARRGGFLSHGKHRLHKMLCCTLKSLEIRAEHDSPTETQIFNLISISFATCIPCGNKEFLSPLRLKPTKILIL